LVSLNLSRHAAQYPKMENALASGILMACGTMFIRVLLLVSILNQVLLGMLLPPMLVMSIFTYLIALILWKKTNDVPMRQEFGLENPFQLGMALKFAAFLTVILLLSRVVKIYFGDMGTYFLAAISGIADVDPIILSMAKISDNGSELEIATRAILIAVSVNSCVKGIISWVVGGEHMGLRVGGTMIVAVVAGLTLG
ncbi:MAG: DUF4010 domain-containing protein, partial [Methylosarcina sp.]